MNVLVLNAGSATLKFQLIRTDADRIANDQDERLAKGLVERIGGEALLRFESGGKPPQRSSAPLRDHRAAVDAVLRWLVSDEADTGLRSLADIEGVGHRVAHGGERFTRSVLITPEVVRGIEDMIDLAPLHNPHALKGIMAAREVLGRDIPQAAVFDTSFHHTLPEQAYLYAIPYSLYRRYRIRRYGFHGTSYRYMAYRYRKLAGKTREDTNLVCLHMGNGSSACAIKGGISVDTSMGFTPLEGLVMGTRSGDIDPAVMDFIAAKEGLSIHDVDLLLNKQSGLLGVSGLTNDMRELLAEELEHDDRRARLAIELFCYRARKYIGSYLAAMNGTDAIVFAGGIGENSPEVRARILDGLQWMGVEVNAERNASMTRGREGVISTDDSRLTAWVIPTDEELLIARDTMRLVHGLELPH
jgi:acetate kinase